MFLGFCCSNACQLYYIHTYALRQLLELIHRGCACCLHTGHSLGGALATLAAYDIRKQLQASGNQDVEVMCYSFGAPRTGNHAFAADYNHVVPDTWSIINEQACLGLAAAWVLASVSCLCLPLCVCATQVGQHRHVVASSVSMAYGNNGDAGGDAACACVARPFACHAAAKMYTCLFHIKSRCVSPSIQCTVYCVTGCGDQRGQVPLPVQAPWSPGHCERWGPHDGVTVFHRSITPSKSCRCVYMRVGACA